jgi:hypothetical protein
MTMRAIIRRRVYHAGSGSGGRVAGRSAPIPADAPHVRFRDPPLFHDELDPTASRWWRATRMGRRVNSAARN